MNDTPQLSKPKYFYCYCDSETILQHLSDSQAGILWKMIFAYVNRGEKSNISDPIVSMAFDIMIQQIDRDFTKYQDKCEKNRANAYQRKRTHTNASDGSQEKEENKEKEKGKDKDKDKDIISSTSVDCRNAFDYQAVVNSFNSICSSLPKVQKLNDKRRKSIKSAASLLGEMSFEEYFKLIESSDFLSGRSGRWTGCCFDWVLNGANLTKVVEGNYSDRQPQTNRMIERDYSGDFWED